MKPNYIRLLDRLVWQPVTLGGFLRGSSCRVATFRPNRPSLSQTGRIVLRRCRKKRGRQTPVVDSIEETSIRCAYSSRRMARFRPNRPSLSRTARIGLRRRRK